VFCHEFKILVHTCILFINKLNFLKLHALQFISVLAFLLDIQKNPLFPNVSSFIIPRQLMENLLALIGIFRCNYVVYINMTRQDVA